MTSVKLGDYYAIFVIVLTVSILSIIPIQSQNNIADA